MATTYSGRTFSTGDRVSFTKFANSIYATSYNAQSGQLGTLTGTVKTLYASSYNFPILVTSVSNSSTSFSYDFTIKPGDATKGYKVTVTYSHNGGSGTGSQSGYVGASLSGTSSRTGYTFAGWYTSSSGGSRVTTVPANAATYYAHWTAKTYKVTFNANGGSGSTSVNETYGSHYSMPSSPTRTGYTFAGWYTSQSGGTRVTSSTTMNTASAHTLYAHWTAHTYTVTFYGNGATSGSMSQQSFTYGQSKALSANGYGRGAAYTFTGWNKNASGTSTAYSNQQKVSNLTSTNGGNINLYAQWKLQYLAPSITNITAIRTDSSGNAQDDGKYLTVSCTCKANTTISSSNKVATVVVKTKAKSESSWTQMTSVSPNVATYNLSVTSPSASFGTDTVYNIQIEVTDTAGSGFGISAPQAKAQTFLSKAFFIMDFAAGGDGVGLGITAPSSGMDVGFKTSFYNNSVNIEQTAAQNTANGGTMYIVKMSGSTLYNETGRIGLGFGGAGDNMGVYIANHGAVTSGYYLIREYYARGTPRIEIGNSDVNGVRLLGHSSNIGAMLTDDGTKSLSSGTSLVKIADPFALPVGSWIVFASVQFPDNSTGTRAARLYFGGTASGTAYAAYPSGAGLRAMSISAPYNVSSGTVDVDLYARQNSGGALTVTYYVRAMRIA